MGPCSNDSVYHSHMKRNIISRFDKRSHRHGKCRIVVDSGGQRDKSGREP